MFYHSSQVTKILFQSISELERQPEKYAVDPSKCFVRHRKLPFHFMTRILLTMAATSTYGEMRKHFLYRKDMPTVSAFLQQKDKILPHAYAHLLAMFNARFPPRLHRGKYLLHAVDGSSFEIFRDPRDHETYFGPREQAKRGFNLLHAVMQYDLLSSRFDDMILQPGRKMNEPAALCALADRARNNAHKTIFIADRGFSGYNVYAHMEENDQAYVIRVKDLHVSWMLYGVSRSLPDTVDTTVNRILSRSQAKSKRIHPEREEDYRYISDNVAFDFLTPECPEYHLTLRVVRFRLENGQYENLVTNLSKDEFSAKELMKIYHKRWDIETAFDQLKNAIGAIAFHSKKRRGVELELWIRLVFLNYCAAIAQTADKIAQKTKKHPYKVNFSNLVKDCRLFLTHNQETGPPGHAVLLPCSFLPVRTGRMYPRPRHFRKPVSFAHRI